MSRLDSAIRRLEAQRACLDLAARLIADVPGPVLELGLGNGRTYDHLRARLPGRAVFAVDRQVAAHPDCVPDAAHLKLGELQAVLPGVVAWMGARAALVHADLGSGDAAASRRQAAWLAPLIVPLVASGGVVASDQAMDVPGWRAVALPPGVAAGRYFLWRAGPG